MTRSARLLGATAALILLAAAATLWFDTSASATTGASALVEQP